MIQVQQWRLLSWLTSLWLLGRGDNPGATTHGKPPRTAVNQLNSPIRDQQPVGRAEGKEPGAELDFNGQEYILQNGMLYRQQGSVLQLVVPQAARDTILTLGHSVPWAGHLGVPVAWH
ncbi:hypothetical protein GJAV_G00081920 [Gymnothorax javanicus]|nr:hypothetical protein GJAV_G00081920 [Gymnothorax javanicus]